MNVIVITGATSGIGYSCVKKFLIKQNIVVGIGRNLQKLKKIKNDFKSQNTKFIGLKCDFEKKNDMKFLINKLLKFKKIDTLINCAGLSHKGKIKDIKLKDWNRLMYVNVTVPYLLTQKLLLKLANSNNPAVVNVSSIAGRSRSISLGCHYTTSKAALIGMTRHLAAELATKKIRVNCCAPSQTLTPMLIKSLSKKGQKKLIENIPLKRLSSANEQSEVIYFLASEKSSYINGAIIDVNGGQL